MGPRSTRKIGFTLLAGFVTFSAFWLTGWPGLDATPKAAGESTVMPQYDTEGHLLLPDDYRHWTLVGSSLGLNYNQGGGGMQMFHSTLMEPTAYEHFARTGTFREGTMFVLLLQGMGDGELPGRRGHFASDVHAVEMAVKDGQTFDEGWAYFDFGGMGGLRDHASAFEAASCYNCHAEHARHDNVFLQFYPLLQEVAPKDSTFRTTVQAIGSLDQRGEHAIDNRSDER